MKFQTFAVILATALLAACQNTPGSAPLTQSTGRQVQHIWQNLPQTQAEFEAQTADIRRAAQGQAVQQTQHFDGDWHPVAQKDLQGFYRESYGLQDNGLYLMQDFYGNGRPQTSLFYGTQPEDTASEDARGYLALYKPDGALDMVQYSVNNEFYSSNNFCGGSVCLRFNQRGARFEEIVLKQGKTLAVRTFENNVLARYEAFYPNGQTAYLIEAQGFGDPKNYRKTQQYYLPDGEKSDGKPDVVEFIQLEREVLAAEQEAYRREADETAWQDAAAGYPEIEQQIENMRIWNAY